MDAPIPTPAHLTANPVAAVQAAAEPGTVQADIVYLAGKHPAPRSIYREGSDIAERTGRYEPYRVAVHDARPIAGDLSLDGAGFILLREPTAVADFFNETQVRDVYYGEVEQLVKARTGAKDVVVFDHTIRVQRAQGETIGQRAPVTLVHNDYTHKSGAQRVRDLLDGERADRWLQGRVAEFNLWRPIRGPLRSMPLAICDARSVAPDDLVTVDLVYPDRVGEIYNAVYSPAHRWFYVPDMQADEALLFKGYDSQTDGRARFTLHTAFDLPQANAAPRESIEVRALAYFG